jgi:2-polyprenyl-6-methoxyphenol hydroxylase-like FAD-dependent oxidoreductase
MTHEHTPVLIVGAGGTGLSLLLHQQGIVSVLVERRPEVSWVPRAQPQLPYAGSVSGIGTGRGGTHCWG